MSDWQAVPVSGGFGSISTVSENCIATETHMIMNSAAPTSAAAWPTANTAFYIPVQVPRQVTVYQMAWYNGTITTAPNVDVGIYDFNSKLLVSSGTVLQSGASAVQSANITDTTLVPGTYFLAMACSGTGSQFQRYSTAAGSFMRGSGCASQASAFNLPATATMVFPPASGYLPVIYAQYTSSTL